MEIKEQFVLNLSRYVTFLRKYLSNKKEFRRLSDE